MKNVQRVLFYTAAAAAIIGIGVPAFAGDYSANVRLDNTYLSNYKVYGNTVPTPGEVIDTNKRGLEQSGRVEFNASGKVGDEFFAAGRGTLLENRGSTTSIDDMWFQFGNKSFDVKLGRFEAYNLFPTPGDVLVMHAGPVYQGNLLRGRDANSKNYGQGQFHGAGTFKMGNLALELGVVEFKQTEKTEGPVPPTVASPHIYPDNAKGFRPVVSFAAGPLTLAAGAEIVKYGNGNDGTSVAGLASFDFGFMALNGSVGVSKEDNDSVGQKAHKDTTFAVTGSSKIGLAGGVFLASNEQNAGVKKGKVTTIYASYTAPLFDLKGATWSVGLNNSTRGGSYKKTNLDGGGYNVTPADGENNAHYQTSNHDETGVCLRFEYAF